MRVFDVVDWSYDHNKMTRALCKHLTQQINLRKKETTPDELEDIVTEWLGEHGKKFRQCSPERVLCLRGTFFSSPIGVFRIDYLSEGRIMSRPVYWVRFSKEVGDET